MSMKTPTTTAMASERTTNDRIDIQAMTRLISQVQALPADVLHRVNGVIGEIGSYLEEQTTTEDPEEIMDLIAEVDDALQALNTAMQQPEAPAVQAQVLQLIRLLQEARHILEIS